MELTLHKPTGLYHRLWMMDVEIIRDVYHVYDISKIIKKDIVFDIGLNIGAFTYRVASEVSFVYGFEPDPENFKIATINNRRLKNVLLFNKAVIENNDLKRKLYKAKNSPNAGIYSLCYPNRSDSIEVDCINYETILNLYKPTVIKCDIEGGEYPIFTKDFPPFVRILIIEFHFTKKADKAKFQNYLDRMLEQFKIFKPIRYHLYGASVVHLIRKENE